MSQRERKSCQFLWTWYCWTKCFVPHISSQHRPFIFKGPKNHRHFTLAFRSCKIWPIPLTRNVGKGVPRDAVSITRKTEALRIQLEDLKLVRKLQNSQLCVVLSLLNYFCCCYCRCIVNNKYCGSIKDQLDVTRYFISLLICSTRFGH